MKTQFLLFALTLPAFSQAEFRPIFNGTDLTGWSPVIENAAPGKDPQGLISVHDGSIHMYRNVKDGDLVPFGVVVSDDSFSRYHLRFQYRWTGKKFAPRAKVLRDAGVIYHAYEYSQVWPKGVESQVQEGDTGDLIWCNTFGLTWMRPAGEHAPESQGLPGLLPENGGLLRKIGMNHEYIGRYPEYDNYQGWTNVNVIAQANEWATHKVNGRVLSRLRDLRKPDDKPLTEGRITLQLEGAEIQYRNIELKELPAPLKPSIPQLTLCTRHGEIGDTTVSISNPGPAALDATPRLIGKDAEFFSVEPATATVAPGTSVEFHIRFAPQGFGGRYCAAVQFGNEETGAFVPVNALGFGEGTEPSLQEIVDALSIPVTIGTGRTHDAKSPRLGGSTHARSFISTKDGKGWIAPVAAFPDDDGAIPPLSLFTEVDPDLKPVAAAKPVIGLNPDLLAAAGAGTLDESAYQNFPAPDSAFGLCLGTEFATSHERKSAAKTRYKARIYKVDRLLESETQDAWLVCFETGGVCDYNDAIYLLANVSPWRTPESWPQEEKRWSLKEIRKGLGLSEQ